jgi:hypothetical protein
MRVTVKNNTPGAELVAVGKFIIAGGDPFFLIGQGISKTKWLMY